MKVIELSFFMRFHSKCIRGFRLLVHLKFATEELIEALCGIIPKI